MNSLKKIDLKNKKVLLRVDFNVPISDNNTITNTYRIDTSLPTIRYILSKNIKKLYIISHLGRPKGKYNKKLDLSLVYKYLSSVIKEKILFISGCIIKKNTVYKEKIVLFDNIRFNPEEEESNINEKVISFRQYLTSLCDVYVNDAFGCCHRNHSSIVGIDAKVKSPGFLIEKELYYLRELFRDSKRGITTAIIGGSKIHDKIKLLNNIIPKVNYIILGGGMIFTFLKFFGIPIGKSLFDKEGFYQIINIVKKADKYNTKIIYPIDFICNNSFSNKGNIIYKTINEGIPKNYMGLDIGKNTIFNIKKILKKSNTIIWNGPLGVFEFSNFSRGSREIMECMSKLNNTITIIGGGDTTACCMKFNCHRYMTHVSTGGGASLQLISGNILPGIKHLEK